MAEIVTFGCRLNTVESEAIRAHTLHLPDTIVVNTCAVTAAAERDARHAVARLHRDHPGAPIVVTGCAVQIDPARWAGLPGVTQVLGNQEKLRPEYWREYWRGADSCVQDISRATTHRPAALSGLENRARAFLDVQQGCDHSCTFCIIPQGRGPSRSVPIPAVVAQARRLVSAGVNEIVLTGVDVASWSDEAGLGTLIRAVLRAVPELPRLRLSTLDPAALDDAFWDALAGEDRLMPQLHLSLQAGSDLILKRMRRRHSRGAALDVIARARVLRPGLAIGADLIAGFPTETDALFDETVRVVDEGAIPYLHVFPYSPRPGTPAARMPQVPPAIRRVRAARLREAAIPHAARFHAGLLGTEAQIVVERGGRGHTEHFAPVRLRSPAPVGSLVSRRIVEADAAGLEAD